MRGLGKVYPGGVEALRDINVSFPRGQLTTLLGPSGCGKTTLLKIIAGLIPATGGSDPGQRPAGRRPWAGAGLRVPGLRAAALGHHPAQRRLRARAARRAAGRSARRSRGQHLREVGLAGFEDRYPHELSGGMRQRVGLARALAVDADVLLMDEPFSAVDEQTRRKFQEDLLRLVDVERKTFIFVTHSIEEAVYVSDRVVLLSSRPGRVWREIETRLGIDRRPRRDPPQPALSRHWSTRSGSCSSSTWTRSGASAGHPARASR